MTDCTSNTRCFFVFYLPKYNRIEKKPVENQQCKTRGQDILSKCRFEYSISSNFCDSFSQKIKSTCNKDKFSKKMVKFPEE